MKKTLFIALIITAALCMGLSSCMTTPEGGSSGSLTIHYYRYDQNYDGWNLWVWYSDPGEEGQGYEFGAPDENGWVTASIPMPSYVMEFGYIVRKSVPGNDWDSKDITDDRFHRNREIWVVTEDARTYSTMPNIKK